MPTTTPIVITPSPTLAPVITAPQGGVAITIPAGQISGEAPAGSETQTPVTAITLTGSAPAQTEFIITPASFSQKYTLNGTPLYFGQMHTANPADESLQATVAFRVSDSNIDISTETAVLSAFGPAGWVELPTVAVEHASGYYVFESVTKGLSLFAVVKKSRAEATVTEAPIAPTVEQTKYTTATAPFASMLGDFASDGVTGTLSRTLITIIHWIRLLLGLEVA